MILKVGKFSQNGTNPTFKAEILTTVYGIFFMPLNFHEFHELFWIREIKFMKCCRNVIAILMFLVKTSVKLHGFGKF